MINELKLVTGEEIRKKELLSFLRRFFPDTKFRFIRDHHQWLYRGLNNQWIVKTENEIAAYCAVISVSCSLNGKPIPALWWVDLIVDPKFRGQGVQTLIDLRIRATGRIKLGFPNARAAKIHQKHGWGVREDGDMLLLPLHPLKIKKVLLAKGWRKAMMKFGALAVLPVYWYLRNRILYAKIEKAYRVDNPDPYVLSDLFERYKDQYPVTIYRDQSFWEWRYLSAPYRGEIFFYFKGAPKKPSHCVVTRHLKTDGGTVARILDIFGDINELSGFQQTLTLAIQDAIKCGAVQVTTINFFPEFRPIWRWLGFLVRTPGRFCWHGNDQNFTDICDHQQHWVLGDSDNDAPD
jgi:hypothetical protein